VNFSLLSLSSSPLLNEVFNFVGVVANFQIGVKIHIALFLRTAHLKNYPVIPADFVAEQLSYSFRPESHEI
jgi:hypothetical protein